MEDNTVLTKEVKELLYQLYDKELELKIESDKIKMEKINLPAHKQNLHADTGTVPLQIEIKNIKKELIKNNYGERKLTN